ncbi:hypothetical protein F8M41_024323 [Gigaspora margarita]|uniref:Uncharacterized protein n=1 Tax=Gigaspora margarita TaxID=4874 RepID=A0A8H4ABW1_GIGMA|nr:hypothetical protein F8M41_024323 [Gigaspora margarita]
MELPETWSTYLETDPSSIVNPSKVKYSNWEMEYDDEEMRYSNEKMSQNESERESNDEVNASLQLHKNIGCQSNNVLPVETLNEVKSFITNVLNLGQVQVQAQN